MTNIKHQNIKHQKIPVNELKLGMFVSELDKPWIESDFMLQGFVVEDPLQIDKIKSICNYVYINRTKSIGVAFAAEPKRNVAIKRSSIIKIKAPSEVKKKKTPHLNKARLGKKVSFFEILRELKNHQKLTNTTPNNPDGKLLYTKESDSTPLEKVKTTQFRTSSNPSFANPINSIFDFFSHFVGGLFKSEKLKPSFQIKYKDPNLSHLKQDERIIYEQEPSVEQEIAEILPIFEQSEVVTRNLFDTIADGRNMDISHVSDAIDQMVDSIERTPDALLWLAKLKKADDLAYNQALSVSITSMAFNSFLALSKEEIKISGFAGLLQDVGKINLSSEVLSKKDKLTKDEYEYVQRHVDESLIILREAADIPREVIRLIASHHERIDGTGYPFRIKGQELSILSQSAGLIDTYCAITSHRSYAEAQSHEEALNEIHALSGKQFSAEIFEQFTQFMGIYPVSSLVELNTGEVGVVIQQNQVRRLMPRVMLILDHQKQRYKAPVVLDLIYKPISANGDLYKIVKSISDDSYGLNPSEFYV